MSIDHGKVLALLKIAVCPNKENGCDGEQYPVGDPAGDFHGEQCQWCAERREAMAAEIDRLAEAADGESIESPQSHAYYNAVRAPAQPANDKSVRLVRFIGINPLEIGAGATEPMLRDSWRFAFSEGDDGVLRFAFNDDGPLVATAATAHPAEAVEGDAYEVREDGKRVRKDRWETGFRSIVSALVGPRVEFEISDIVEEVRSLANKADDAAQGAVEGGLPPMQSPIPTKREAHEAIQSALTDATKALRVLSTMLKKEKLMQGYAVSDEILGSIGYAEKMNTALKDDAHDAAQGAVACAHHWYDYGQVNRSWCSKCQAMAVTGYEDTPYTRPQAALAQGDGVGLIAAERRRQVEAEGWTPEHDDEHFDGSLAVAAACYATQEGQGLYYNGKKARDAILVYWPWFAKWWKPSPENRLHELAKAGALIAAEIDRLQRAAAPSPEPRS